MRILGNERELKYVYFWASTTTCELTCSLHFLPTVAPTTSSPTTSPTTLNPTVGPSSAPTLNPTGECQSFSISCVNGFAGNYSMENETYFYSGDGSVAFTHNQNEWVFSNVGSRSEKLLSVQHQLQTGFDQLRRWKIPGNDRSSLIFSNGISHTNGHKEVLCLKLLTLHFLMKINFWKQFQVVAFLKQFSKFSYNVWLSLRKFRRKIAK